MKKTILLVVLLIGSITLTGCGQRVAEKATEKAVESATGGKVDVNYGLDGSTTYTADGVTVSTSDKLPKDWPKDASIYPNANIDVTGLSVQEDNSGLAVVLNTEDSGEKVFEYYKTEMEKNGWAIESASSFGEIRAISGVKNGKNFTALITVQEGRTQIVLGISEEK